MFIKYCKFNDTKIRRTYLHSCIFDKIIFIIDIFEKKLLLYYQRDTITILDQLLESKGKYEVCHGAIETISSNFEVTRLTVSKIWTGAEEQ